MLNVNWICISYLHKYINLTIYRFHSFFDILNLVALLLVTCPLVKLLVFGLRLVPLDVLRSGVVDFDGVFVFSEDLKLSRFIILFFGNVFGVCGENFAGPKKTNLLRKDRNRLNSRLTFCGTSDRWPAPSLHGRKSSPSFNSGPWWHFWIRWC